MLDLSAKYPSARLRHYADRAAKHRIASWRGGEVQQDRREGYSHPIAMAPSHTGMQHPMLSRNIEIDRVWNIDRIRKLDPCSFIGNIANSAGQRLDLRPSLK
jgi:hypothetical protein